MKPLLMKSPRKIFRCLISSESWWDSWCNNFSKILLLLVIKMYLKEVLLFSAEITAINSLMELFCFFQLIVTLDLWWLQRACEDQYWNNALRAVNLFLLKELKI
jgi:hypothetical protein